MTNLSSNFPTWRRRLTRERILVGAPVLLAALVAVGLVVVDGIPRYWRTQDQKARLDELKDKESRLPQLQSQLTTTRTDVRKQERRQELLVDLIATPEQIQTFMAQLSREAGATGVDIVSYEPVPADPVVVLEDSASTSSRPDAELPKDPFLELGYVKSSILLEALGPFNNIKAFLRRMESQRLTVQASDLALKVIKGKTDNKYSNKNLINPSLTRLSLRLTFFNKISSDAQAEPPLALSGNQASKSLSFHDDFAG
ncbi:MAG: hypothetical protein ACON4T_02240 [Synechococcus sp.]